MTPEQFLIWLEGYLDANDFGGKDLRIIKEKFNTINFYNYPNFPYIPSAEPYPYYPPIIWTC